MKVLVTGAGGQLGRALIELGSDRVQVVPFFLEDLDITDHAAVHAAIGDSHPDVVVNAAAYTAVDSAEEEVDAAFRANRDGVDNIADACDRHSVPVIHVSTDYVFDGWREEPYTEQDEPNPINFYGASKLAGEECLRARNSNHVILRTSWVFSETGNNFVKTILRLAREREELSIVSDQIGRPTAAGDIAVAVVTIAERLSSGGSELRGTFHYGGDPPISWFEFARSIVTIASEMQDLAVERISPITTAEFPTPAARPAYSILDCSKLHAVYGIELPSWEHSLRRVLANLMEPVPITNKTAVVK